MSNTKSPLSPHLSIYRWPVTMTLSILHRFTGVVMTAGLVVLALWLVQAAAGPEQYQQVRFTMGSPPGQALLGVFSFAFFLHLCNGIRHLVWDLGYGFEKRQANTTAWIVLAVAAVLTVAFWIFAA